MDSWPSHFHESGFFCDFEAVPRRREQLQGEGIVFRSQTDTEVIAQLIGRELDAQPDVELRDAVSRSLQKCEGTWGV